MGKNQVSCFFLTHGVHVAHLTPHCTPTPSRWCRPCWDEERGRPSKICSSPMVIVPNFVAVGQMIWDPQKTWAFASSLSRSLSQVYRSNTPRSGDTYDFLLVIHINYGSISYSVSEIIGNSCRKCIFFLPRLYITPKLTGLLTELRNGVWEYKKTTVDWWS